MRWKGLAAGKATKLTKVCRNCTRMSTGHIWRGLILAVRPPSFHLFNLLVLPPTSFQNFSHYNKFPSKSQDTIWFQHQLFLHFHHNVSTTFQPCSNHCGCVLKVRQLDALSSTSNDHLDLKLTSLNRSIRPYSLEIRTPVRSPIDRSSSASSCYFFHATRVFCFRPA